MIPVDDPLGRRIQKNVTGVITRYVYDNEDLLLEYDGANQLLARYTHGPGIDEPWLLERDLDRSGTFEPTEVFTYHADALGSIVAMTDATGAVVRSYRYDSFGNLLAETGTLAQPYGFTGREYDRESGLYYSRARYYDPRIGRFLSEDPLDFGAALLSGASLTPDNILLQTLLTDPQQSTNRYGYTANSPVNYTDPYGLLIPGDPDPSDEIAIFLALRAGGRIVGRVITGIKWEGIHWIISCMVPPAWILDALRNPQAVTQKIDRFGRQSFRIIGERASVVINRFGGDIVTAWRRCGLPGKEK